MAMSRDLTRGLRARRLRWLSFFVVVLVAITCGSASAGASVVDHQRFTRSYGDVRWDCGYPLSVVGVESHNVLVRADKKLADHVFVTDNFDFTEVWTAAGRPAFTLAGNAVAKDVKSKSRRRIRLRIHLPNNRSAHGDHRLVRDRRRPQPGQHLVPLHDRRRHRRIQLPWAEDLGTPSAVQR